jgi:predicted transposase/invertase (TIGR01784 family)
MTKSILSPKSDTIFKSIFGNPQNVDILTGFLQAVLDLPEEDYEELALVNPNLNGETPDGKTGIVDVLVKTKSGKSIDIEIQNLAMPEMKERIVYYASKMVAGQAKKGESYGAIKKVVCIVITDYKLIKDSPAYHNRYKLYDAKTGSEFTELLEIDTLELPKLPSAQDGTELFDWLRFLKSREKGELTMLAEHNPKLKRAVAVLMELSEDEKTRMRYEAEEKARRDELSRMQGAYRDGEQRGLAIGEQRGLAIGEQRGLSRGREVGELDGKKFVARRMLSMGLDLADIAEATDLPLEEVEKLRQANIDSATGHTPGAE